MPLGYAWSGLEPEPLLAYDAADCRADDVDLPVQRLNCGHTFHKSCLCPSPQSHDHEYSMSSRATCPICSVQLPSRVKELANTFNKGLLATNEDDEEETSTDDHNGDDDDDDSDSSDDENNDGKPATVAQAILQKAMETIQNLPQAELFKYSCRNAIPVISNSVATPEKADNVSVTCGRVCKTKGGLTQHKATHR